MKSTTIKKRTQGIGWHRLWVVLACVGLAIIWYSLVIVLFLFSLEIIENYAASSMVGYGILQTFHTPILMGVATLLTIPFAVIAFKKLKVSRPRFTAMAFILMLFFTFCLHGLLLDLVPVLWYQYEWGIWVALGSSLAVSALIYGFIIRKLTTRLPRKWLVALIISLPLIALSIDVIYRFSFGFL